MQGFTGVAGEQKKNGYDFFSVALVTVVVFAVGIALIVYRHAYGSGLSVEPDNWSAFGSYIGGIFGPLISFLTLLAILKTIGLQKKLLDTQRAEFADMQALQLKAIDAQLTQIRQSDEQSARRLIEETRMSALQALDKYLHGMRAEYEQKMKQLDSLYQWVIDGKITASTEDVARVAKKLKEYEEKLAGLTMLYGDICFGTFENVEDLKAKFHDEIAELWHSGQEPPEDAKDQ